MTAKQTRATAKETKPPAPLVGLLTLKDVEVVTKHSGQTIYNWRHGVGCQEKLVCVEKRHRGSRRVFVTPKDLEKFAKVKEIALDKRALERALKVVH